MHIPVDLLILALASLGAGAINSIAGGGSFLTFPALVYAGVPSVLASASSTVALLPATGVSAWTFRRELKGLPDVGMPWLIGSGLAGGIVGGLLLFVTPSHIFDHIVPWLLGLATIVFASGRQLAAAVKRLGKVGPKTLIAVHFVLGIYAGYFGGAVGFLILALYTLFGMTDLHAMNALRAVMGGLMNASAVVVFIVTGSVAWQQTLIVMASAMIGGYIGARIARATNQQRLRQIIIGIGAIMTVVFFIRS
jgi:uncharacterized membrane protein YfcA